MSEYQDPDNKDEFPWFDYVSVLFGSAILFISVLLLFEDRNFLFEGTYLSRGGYMANILFLILGFVMFYFPLKRIIASKKKKNDP